MPTAILILAIEQRMSLARFAVVMGLSYEGQKTFSDNRTFHFFITGAAILGAGTIVFLRDHKA